MSTIEIHEPVKPATPKPYERWVRPPVRAGERLQGVSRAGIYQLIKEGEIRSAVIRKPGNVQGIRLIWEQSLVDFIERHVVDEGAA